MKLSKLTKALAENNDKQCSQIVEAVRKIREEYTYLQDMPLEGWVWEFIRRNAAYIGLYREIESAFKATNIIRDDADLQGIHDSILASPMKEKLNRLMTDFGIGVRLYPSKPHDADNFMNIDSIDFLIEIPNPITKYNQFCRTFPDIEGATCVRYSFFGIEPNYSYGHFRADVEKGAIPEGAIDTLYLAISLHSKKSDILKQLDRLLDEFVPPVMERQRDDKWHYYLIAYDLFNEGYNYAEIADIMIQAFGADIDENAKDEKTKKKAVAFLKLFDVKNMENYHKNAVSLINGGYKKYLYLPK